MSNIVEIIRIIEANLNTLNERIIALETSVADIRTDLNEMKQYITDDGR